MSSISGCGKWRQALPSTPHTRPHFSTSSMPLSTFSSSLIPVRPSPAFGAIVVYRVNHSPALAHPFSQWVLCRLHWISAPFQLVHTPFQLDYHVQCVPFKQRHAVVVVLERAFTAFAGQPALPECLLYFFRGHPYHPSYFGRNPWSQNEPLSITLSWYEHRPTPPFLLEYCS